MSDAPYKDEFADKRLPDIPNAGYSTPREKELSDAVMFFVRGAERDRLWLLSMVCDGKGKFRSVMLKAWKYLKVDEDLIDSIYGYLELLAGPYPTLQRDQLLRMNHLSPVQRIFEQTGLAPTPTLIDIKRKH